jgi:DNA-binding CsgD family transcriptional regulator
VRASIDWCHRLLHSSEQCLLRRLAVFADSFTLDAAEAVCAFDGLQSSEIAFVLDRLVAQSLVQTSRHEQTTRFCLWLPVRQYALERLALTEDEATATHARLAEWHAQHGAHEACAVADASRGLHALHQAGPEPGAERARPSHTRGRGRRPGVLSEREHDVVLLIAGGRSNREIADELVITKKTAEAHVSHILTKLGLCSRVQIATWSLQQGLVREAS